MKFPIINLLITAFSFNTSPSPVTEIGGRYLFFSGLINEFAVNPTKDLSEAVGGALTMSKGDVRQGQRK